MAMNVPTWGNAGVSPTEERKREGYSAGQNLPANHLNWFLYQTFTNLAEAKEQITALETQSGGNNTYINSVRAYINDLVANMPVRVIFGKYTGTGGDQNINIGVTPSVVLTGKAIGGSDVFLAYNGGAVTQSDGTIRLKVITNGFTAGYTTNTSGEVFYYVALVEY